MHLQMRSALGDAYKSGSQKTRVISEDWAESNLYCPACPSETLRRLGHNTKSSDFQCSDCSSWFQLKSTKTSFGNSILDGAYLAMCATIEAGKTPSLFMLQYDAESWKIRNLKVIPSFAFPLSCVRPRKPLSAQAERKFYVGCYIMLTSIPPDAHIHVITNGAEESPERVRQQFDLLRPISKLNAKQRGWTLDVLSKVRALNQQVFTLRGLLQHADELRHLHPDNNNVGAKIRQQLQLLRDFGILEFVDNRGTYRLKEGARAERALEAHPVKS
jgi:type II restriction enzyme